MTAFGPLLRRLRRRARLGLRTFAGLVDERASVVSAIESERRSAWRREQRLRRVAEVLGLSESSEAWQEFFDRAREAAEFNGPVGISNPGEAALLWWRTTDEAPSLEPATAAELAEFVSANLQAPTAEEKAPKVARAQPSLPVFTELAIEWRVRRLLGRRAAPVAAAPIDVESVLENTARVRLEIVPGLVPRFSVSACVVKTPEGLTFFVDRILADSRPTSSYRYLLATCFAPLALWGEIDGGPPNAAWFGRLQSGPAWPQALRDCERFALAMLLPADLVLAAAEAAYSELVQQQGWVELDVGAGAVRNRLAEQFAVPPSLVHRRLVGWPCHLYGRIAQALAAQEPTLPPTDWWVEEDSQRQRLLFEVRV